MTELKLISVTDHIKPEWLSVLDYGPVTIDVETAGVDVRTAKLVLLGIYLPDNNTVLSCAVKHTDTSQLIHKATLQELMRALARTHIIGHNVAFDVSILHYSLGIDLSSRVLWDTKLASHVINENQNSALENLAATVLGATPWKEQQSFDDLLNCDLDALRRYNATDTFFTHALYKAQTDELGRTARYTLLHEWLIPALQRYIQIQYNGMPVSLRVVRRVFDNLQQDIDRYTVKLLQTAEALALDTAKFSFNANALTFKKFMKTLIPQGSPKQTTKGNESWARDVLIQLRLDAAPELAEILDTLLALRTAEKQSQFLTQWERAATDAKRIHPTFKLTSTDTGRTSCSNPNLQQVPRASALKRCFRPPENFVWFEADYSQIELRIAAVLYDEPIMQKKLTADEDLHLYMAQRITGKEDISKEERTAGKIANFGFLYGMGARKFQQYALASYGLSFTLNECNNFRQEFFTAYPCIEAGHQRFISEAFDKGYVTMPSGRRRHLPQIRSSDPEAAAQAERQAINAPVQGFSSDILLKALPQVEDIVKKLGGQVSATVHDSIVGIIPAAIAADEIKLIADTMCIPPTSYPEKESHYNNAVWKLSVPLKVDLAVGNYWGDNSILQYSTLNLDGAG